ncbi:MAG: Shedu anti-phage system protein SduA domain-containing protein [Rhodoplanes sp.]
MIEIENTKTRLMTRSGDEAAPLAHAMGQVRNWLHIADEHRQAVLECLGIERVAVVKGVVIAGRDSGYKPEHLRRLKGVDRGRVSFLTFDDVAGGLERSQADFRNCNCC